MSLDEFIIGAAFLSDRVPVKLPWMSPEGESGDRASPITPGEWRKDTFDKPLTDTWDDFSDTRGRSTADSSGGIVSKQYTENVMTKLALGELSIASVSMGPGQKVKSNNTKPLNENKIEDMGFEEMFANSPVKSKAAFKSDYSSSVTDSYFAQKEKKASNKSRIVDVGLEEMFSRRPSTSSPCLGNAQPRSNQLPKFLSPDDVLDMPNNSFTKGLNEKKEFLKSSKSFPNEPLSFGNGPGVVSPGPYSGRTGALSELGTASYIGDKPSLLDTYNNTSPIETGYVPSFISDNTSDTKRPTRKLPISATQPLKANKAFETDRNSVLSRKGPFEEYKKSSEVKRPDFFGSSSIKSVSDRLPQYESDENDTPSGRPQILPYRPNALPSYKKKVPSFLEAVSYKDDFEMRPLSTLFATYGQASAVVQDLDNPNLIEEDDNDYGPWNHVSVPEGKPSFGYKSEFEEKSTSVISNVHDNVGTVMAKTENTEVTTCSPVSISRSTQPSIIDKVDEIQPVAQEENRIHEKDVLGMGEYINTSKSRDAENTGSLSGQSPPYAGDTKDNVYCGIDKTDDTKTETDRPNVMFDGFSSDEDTHALYDGHVTKPMSQPWNSTRLQPASNPVSAWITKAIESDDDISKQESKNIVEIFSKVEKESGIKRHQAFDVPKVTIDTEDTPIKSSSEIKERKLPKPNKVILVEPASVKREKIKKKKERREKQCIPADNQKRPTDIEKSDVESTISSDASSKLNVEISRDTSVKYKPNKTEVVKPTITDTLAVAATQKTKQRPVTKPNKYPTHTHVTSEVDEPYSTDVVKPRKKEKLAGAAFRKDVHNHITKPNKYPTHTCVTSEDDEPYTTGVVKPLKKDKLAGAAIRKDVQNPIRKPNKYPTHTHVTSEVNEPYTTDVVKPRKEDKLAGSAAPKDVHRPIVKLKKHTKHTCATSEDDEYRVAASGDEEIDREIAINRKKIIRKIKEIRQGIASLKSSSIQINDLSEHEFKHNIMPLMRSMELAYLERDISSCNHCNAQIANSKQQKPMLPERKQLPQLPKRPKETSLKAHEIPTDSEIDPDLADMFSKLHDIYRRYGKKPAFSGIPPEQVIAYLKSATEAMNRRAAEEMSDDEELNGWENDDIGTTVTILFKAKDIIPEKYSKKKTLKKFLKALETQRNNANNRLYMHKMPKEEEDSDLENELDRLGPYYNAKKNKGGSLMKILNCLKGDNKPKGKLGEPEISDYESDTVSTNSKYQNDMVKRNDKAKVASMVKSRTRKNNLRTEFNAESIDMDKVERFGAAQKTRDGGKHDTEADIVKKTKMVKAKSERNCNKQGYDHENGDISKGFTKSNPREKNGRLMKSGYAKLDGKINPPKSSIAEDGRSAPSCEPQTSRLTSEYGRDSFEDEYDNIGHETKTKRRLRNETIKQKETSSGNESDVSDTTTRVTQFVVESSSSSMQSTHDMGKIGSFLKSSDVSSDKSVVRKKLTVVKSVNGPGASLDNAISASKTKPRISGFESDKPTSSRKNNHSVHKIQSTFQLSDVSSDKRKDGHNVKVVKPLSDSGAAIGHEINSPKTKSRVAEFEVEKATSTLKNSHNIDKIRDTFKSGDKSNGKTGTGKNLVVVKPRNNPDAVIDNGMSATKARFKSSDVSSDTSGAGKNLIVVKPRNDQDAANDNGMSATKARFKSSDDSSDTSGAGKNLIVVKPRNDQDAAIDNGMSATKARFKSSDDSSDTSGAGKNLIVVKSLNDQGAAMDNEISATHTKTRLTENDVDDSRNPLQNKHSVDKTESIFKPTSDKRKDVKNLIVVKSLNDSWAIDDTKLESDVQKKGPFASHSSKSSISTKYDKKYKSDKALLSNHESVLTDSSEVFEEVLVLPPTDKKKEPIHVGANADLSPTFERRYVIPRSMEQIKREKKAMLKRRVKWGFFNRSRGKQKPIAAEKIDDKAGTSSNFDQGFDVNTKTFRRRRDKKRRTKGKSKSKRIGKKRHVSGEQFDADHEMDVIQQFDDKNKKDKKRRLKGIFKIKRFGSKKTISNRKLDLDNGVNTVEQSDDRKNRDKKSRKRGKLGIKRFGSKKNVLGEELDLDNGVNTAEQFDDRKINDKKRRKKGRFKIKRFGRKKNVSDKQFDSDNDISSDEQFDDRKKRKQAKRNRKRQKISGYDANVLGEAKASTSKEEDTKTPKERQKGKKERSTSRKMFNVFQGFRDKTATTKKDGAIVKAKVGSSASVNECAHLEDAMVHESRSNKATKYGKTKSKRGNKWFPKKGKTTKEDIGPIIDDAFESETKVVPFREGETSSDSENDNVKQSNFYTTYDIVEQPEVNDKKGKSKRKGFLKSFNKKLSNKKKEAKQIEPSMTRIDDTFERETRVIAFGEGGLSSDENSIFDDVEQTKEAKKEDTTTTKKRESTGKRFWKSLANKFGSSKRNKKHNEVMIPSTDIERETKDDSINESFERETKVVPFREEDTSTDTDIISNIFEKSDVDSEKDIVEQTEVNIDKKEPTGGRLRKFFKNTFGGRSKKN